MVIPALRLGNVVNLRRRISNQVLPLNWFRSMQKSDMSTSNHPDVRSIIKSAESLVSEMGSTTAHIVNADSQGLSLCVERLRQGNLVAFPTETVYGLGADAMNASAVQRVFSTKGRPNSDPVIIHVHARYDLNKIYDYCREDALNKSSFNAKTVVDVLRAAFWPGPLTIVFRAAPSVPSVVTAGSGWVGVRCPSHTIAQALLNAANMPIAAPSANRFGHVSPTTSLHVLDDLGTHPISVLQDDVDSTGGCSFGIESTVCRVAADGCRVSILRCGAVTSSMMLRALRSAGLNECTVHIDNTKHLDNDQKGKPEQQLQIKNDADDEDLIVAPGQMLKHYAPDLPTFIVGSRSSEAQTVFTGGNADLCDGTVPTDIAQQALVFDFGGQLAYLRGCCAAYQDLSVSGNVKEACSVLFAALRVAESDGMKQRGVRLILLPDLRSLLTTAVDATNAVDVATGPQSEALCMVDVGKVRRARAAIVASRNNGEHADGDGDDTFRKSNSSSAMNSSTSRTSSIGIDMVVDRELAQALWERLHRAASGRFI